VVAFNEFRYSEGKYFSSYFAEYIGINMTRGKVVHFNVTSISFYERIPCTINRFQEI